MRKLLLPLLACLALTAAASASDLSPDDAKSHVGENVSVRGAVIQVIVSKNGNAFLNFGGAYPNQTFSAVVLAKRTPALAEGGKTWLTDLKDKNVTVKGTVELNEGKPEIVLTSKEDVHAN